MKLRFFKRLRLFRELWGYMKHHKKWWLAPMVLILILFGILMVVTQGPAGLLIYTLF